MENQKSIIVSSRLPVNIELKDGDWGFQNNEDEFIPGLSDIYDSKDNNLWIGWPGEAVADAEMRTHIQVAMQAEKLLPVWLSEAEAGACYEGFCKEVLWPVFHYLPSSTSFNHHHWEAYITANQKFADLILAHTRPQDIIWIHDYQLLLLPELIRKKMPEARIGLFQHIPFPSPDIFRLIPWRNELLYGMLGADLIGFQTTEDCNHFMDAAKRMLPDAAATGPDSIRMGRRNIKTEAFPMGIDYQKHEQQVLQITTRRNVHKLSRMIDHKKLMLSVDHLDYNKGIRERLDAYEIFLENHPEYQEKIVLLQLIVPHRGDKTKQHILLKKEIDKRIAGINARWGSLTWQPICYFYRSFPREMLSALYAAADIALVTPLRDGMNLVSKEYVASRTGRTGVLILSEMAGACNELQDALMINPHNCLEAANAIYTALNMSLMEQRHRMEHMQEGLRRNDVHYWAETFISRLRTGSRNMQLLKNKAEVWSSYAYSPTA